MNLLEKRKFNKFAWLDSIFKNYYQNYLIFILDLESLKNCINEYFTLNYKHG